ncbi:cytochrome p450 domain-containing protein [Ditylenchus destructor]|uniref:Cytochrome p450 domain-containing protein n=1 Tax=Ditylenchus destructor TaxID=166010 RepID=A0AAD4N5F6_9BILA|nr:cytochrome p450 domain-containing protein [Ditylenchus destructor]
MLLLIFVAFVSILSFYNFYWKKKNFPPGPLPLPILGNLLDLGGSVPCYSKLTDWSKRYGGLYTVWLGESPLIVVSDYKLMQETFGKEGDAYTGSDMVEFNKYATATQGLYGIFSTEGEPWLTLRRFSMQAMRNVGMGRNEGEQKIMTDVDTLIESFEEKIDAGENILDVKPMISLTVGSLINQFVFGSRFHGEKEKEFYILKTFLDEAEEIFADPRFMLLTEAPWLRHFPIFSSLFKWFDENNTVFYNYIDREIQAIERKHALSENDEYESCFVEEFLKEQKRQKSDPNSHFAINHLRGLCFDLFTAGQETTSLTLSFLVLYMVINQDAQKKLQAELDAVIGSPRPILVADKSNLPYTNAVVNETQRLCNLLPLNITHKTTRDIHMKGYKIPNGTKIVPQISCVLFDEKLFPNPEKFQPERFLTDDGRLKQLDGFIPFSIGKRVCLGESLARMELFLVAANVLNRFRFLPEDPMNPPTDKKIRNFGVAPTPFKCKVEKRYN